MRRSTTWYQKPVGIPSTSPASSMNRPMLWNTWGVRMVTKYPRSPIPVSAASRKRISCMRQRVLSPSYPDVLAPCHPEAEPKDLREVLHSAQDDRKGPARRHPLSSAERGHREAHSVT